MSKDYKVGYGKPPKEHQFSKGRSGNPNGRPKKQPADPRDQTLAAILKRVGEQTIEVGGERRTLHEVELLALQAKAAKGDVAASRHLAKLRKEAGLFQAESAKRTGVLVVPGIAKSAEEWEAKAKAQQAKFRGEDPEGLERLYRASGLVTPPRDGENNLD